MCRRLWHNLKLLKNLLESENLVCYAQEDDRSGYQLALVQLFDGTSVSST